MDKTDVMNSIYGVARKSEEVDLEDSNPLVISLSSDPQSINEASELLTNAVGKEKSDNLKIDTDVKNDKVLVTFPNLMEKDYDDDRFKL